METPPEEYVRVDVDVAHNGLQQAACGGLLRHSIGNKNFRKVKIYSNSLEVIQLLLSDYGHNHPLQKIWKLDPSSLAIGTWKYYTLTRNPCYVHIT